MVITRQSGSGDKRKNKKVIYREARLTLAHSIESKTPVFSITFEDITTVGKHTIFEET